MANWRHGYYSAQAKAERQRARDVVWALRYLANTMPK
jgi:hypothetical protein